MQNHRLPDETTTNNEPPMPGGWQQPQQDTAPPVAPSAKKRYLLVAAATLSVLLLAAVAYYAKNADSPNPPNSESSSAGAPDSPQSATARYGDTGIAGLAFEVPEKWTVTKSVNRQQTQDTFYTLYSEDAEAYADGFVLLRKGAAILISAHERDPGNEASYSKPIDAYVSGVGAPRLNEPGVEFYEQKIDTPKLTYHTNKNGTELLSYRWWYEGCYINTHLLGEKTVYTVSIHAGGDCPEVDFLTANQAIAGFIDSLKLSDGDTAIKSDIFAVTTITDNINTCEVYARDTAYKYTSYSDQNSFNHVAYCSSLVAKPGQDGAPGTAFIGSSASAMAESFKCEGCGFLESAYDTTITYADGTAKTEGMEQVAEKTYGKSEAIEAAQKNGSAKRYTYIKQFNKNALTVSFIYEVTKGSAQLPDLKAEHILKTLDSLVMID